MLQHQLSRLLASPPARLGQKFMDDRALTLASLLAWGMLNTFLPLLLGILSLVGLLVGDSAAAAAAEQHLLGFLPAAVGQMVQDIIGSTQRAAAGGAGLISLGLLLFSGSNFFVTLESVFDLAYHVPERNIITQRLVSFAALFVVTALLLLATGVSVLSGAFGEGVNSAIPQLGTVLDAALANTISIVGLMGTMVLMYWLLPNKRHSFRHALPGAAAASIALILAVRIFPLYVALFGGGFNVYAAFGTVLLFMFWLYIVGVILAAGAVLNAFLEDPQASVTQSAFIARVVRGQVDGPGAEIAPPR
jgi:membrane protein